MSALNRVQAVGEWDHLLILVLGIRQLLSFLIRQVGRHALVPELVKITEGVDDHAESRKVSRSGAGGAGGAALSIHLGFNSYSVSPTEILYRLVGEPSDVNLWSSWSPTGHVDKRYSALRKLISMLVVGLANLCPSPQWVSKQLNCRISRRDR